MLQESGLIINSSGVDGIGFYCRVLCYSNGLWFNALIMRTLRKFLVILLFIGLAVFTLVQLIPYGRRHSNPPVLAEPQWDSPTTRALFMRACGDCHSNETVWPWYANIAPMSWLIQRDVDEGRATFNISEWGRKDNEGEEAFEQYKSGKMPLPVYLPLHPEARLIGSEREQLGNGLLATFGGDHGGGEENED